MARQEDLGAAVEWNDRKVSVVITCYKYAHYLKQALDSVLNQTHRNLEVLVINDGSPDNTDEVMEPYLSDPRVRYLRQENAGQAIAKNRGIEASIGEFVAFLDADDAWRKDKLELQLPLFVDPEVGVVYCGQTYMDENGQPAFRETRELMKPKSGWITSDILKDNLIPFCAAVVRRDCFERVGKMNASFRMGIDWDLWLRMSVHYKFDAVNEPLLVYRIGHSGQMSKNYLVREQDTMRIMREFLETNPGVVPAAEIRWAYAYSYCNRAYYFRLMAPLKSLGYLLKAISARWNHWPAYDGIIKWLPRLLFRR